MVRREFSDPQDAHVEELILRSPKPQIPHFDRLHSMARTIRVGIVGPCPPPYGGVTRIIENHLNSWKHLPIDAWLIPPTVPAEPAPYAYAGLLNHRVRAEGWIRYFGSAWRIGSRLTPMRISSLTNILSFDCGLRRAIKEHRLDILYAHHADSSGMVAVTEALEAGIPSVLVAYGETWLSQPAHVRSRKAIDFSATRATWIVSTSEHCRRGAISRGADPNRSSVIYAGVDLDRFRPGLDGRPFRTAHGIPEGAVVVSVLGLALRTKLDTLLDALTPVLDIPNVYLLIGGTGADASYLQEQVRSVGGDRVKALGFVPEDDLPSFYAATDVLVVSPKTVVECMGQSMKEAMACGRTVVGPQLGGVPEAIDDGVNGLFFEPGNPADLVRVLHELVPNAALRESMGARGRQIAEQKFDARTSAQQTFELLDRLVGD